MSKSKRTSPGLLISVRSAEEAQQALDAGADLIDVKDPDKGSMGMAHHETVIKVLEVVKKKVPVSAALGEWSPQAFTEAGWHLELPLSYIKWGLSGYPNQPGWGEDLLIMRRQIPKGMEVVLVSYVDLDKAKCPPPADVVKFAKRFRYAAVLFDTCNKDGKTLLDHVPIAELTEHVNSLKKGGVAVALGGSLRIEQVDKLLPLAPDWIAVRGAVCVGGKRGESLDPVRLKKWRSAI